MYRGQPSSAIWHSPPVRWAYQIVKIVHASVLLCSAGRHWIWIRFCQLATERAVSPWPCFQVCHDHWDMLTCHTTFDSIMADENSETLSPDFLPRIWRRLIVCLKLQVIFCKKATNHRVLSQDFLPRIIAPNTTMLVSWVFSTLLLHTTKSLIFFAGLSLYWCIITDGPRLACRIFIVLYACAWHAVQGGGDIH